MLDGLKRLDDPLQFVGGGRPFEPRDILRQGVGNPFRGFSDAVEGSPDEDISGKRGGQERKDEDRKETVFEEVIFQAEVEKSEQRHKEKKGEDDGQTVVESLAFHGEVKHLFPEIHGGSSAIPF